MKILLTGSGGREFSLVKKCAESLHVTAIAVAPGSDAIGEIRLQNGEPVQCLPFAATDAKAIADWARDAKYDLVVPGPESSLESGLGDLCRKYGVPFAGPCQRGARLELSKAFAHEFCSKYGICQPRGAVFDTFGGARDFLSQNDPGWVIKADGSASGKGVIVPKNLQEAHSAIRRLMIDRILGKAGERVVIQELWKGRELSLHAIADKNGAHLFETARDYKRAGDGDTGENTGGMGAYSPGGELSPERRRQIESIIQSWRAGCAAEEILYRGILYPGLMIRDDDVAVLEFNARFGDPETQVYLQRLESDLPTLLLAAATDTLKPEMLSWHSLGSVCVNAVSGGYGYGKPLDLHHEITGLDDIAKLPQVDIIHAGTKKVNGKWINVGGRVVGIRAWDDTRAGARERAYDAMERLLFEGMHYRRDIARELEF
ncbi:MAG: phosphoribosylamine--glycine ligase [bacterium]|nr:phosphoribosylamine--glycine ligase [bacterium]